MLLLKKFCVGSCCLFYIVENFSDGNFIHHQSIILQHSKEDMHCVLVLSESDSDYQPYTTSGAIGVSNKKCLAYKIKIHNNILV